MCHIASSCHCFVPRDSCATRVTLHTCGIMAQMRNVAGDDQGMKSARDNLVNLMVAAKSTSTPLHDAVCSVSHWVW